MTMPLRNGHGRREADGGASLQRFVAEHAKTLIAVVVAGLLALVLRFAGGYLPR